MAVACGNDSAKDKTRCPTLYKRFHASWDFYLFVVKKATLFLTITDNRGYKPSHEKIMKNWIPVSSVPASGKEFVLDPAADWTATLAEFKLPYDVRELSAVVRLFPQEDGMLARGEFKGNVIMPCTRCAEDAHVRLDQTFDTFEPYPLPDGETATTNSFGASAAAPAEADREIRPKARGTWKPEARKKSGKEARQAEKDAAEQDESDDLSLDVDENVVRISAHGLEINVGNLAFEEFLLALPVKALCSEDCKGLCPECGHNLNTGPCACSRDQGDPRLAALRNLTLGKK